MEDDILIINSVKVNLIHTDPVEECVFTRYNCCRKGKLTMVNKVDTKLDEDSKVPISEPVKEWSCNACFRNFDINESRPWTCNKV